MRSQDQQFISVVPSARQLALQQMEFYAFVHFTVNTFTGKEWGDGTESPSIFHPTRFDANQWCDAIDAWQNGHWRPIAENTVVGYKRIVFLGKVETSALRIRILDARVAPTLKFLGVYA